MRRVRTCAGSGAAGLVLFTVVVGCATADASRHRARAGEPPAASAARREIAARIAKRVDATRRKDLDALLDGAGPGWRRADGSAMTREEERAVLEAELAPVERTLELEVRIDSLRLTSDSSASVYTRQRWARLMSADDGSRHVVETTSWLGQEWGRTAAGWRGLSAVRELRPGMTTIDGNPFVVVRGR